MIEFIKIKLFLLDMSPKIQAFDKSLVPFTEIN